jgi:hypothetical protein
LKGGFYAFEFFDGAVETFDAYREGNDWHKVAIKEGIKIGMATAVPIIIEDGVLAALAFTPVGWVAIIIVAAVEAGTIMLGDDLVDRYMQ